MKYISIFLAIFIAFLISNFAIQNIFIAKSPRIRQNLDRVIVWNLFSPPQKKINNQENKVNENLYYEKLDKNNFVSLNKGVYAADLNNGRYILIKENEVEWIIYTFRIKDKEIKIKVPKGEDPPSQQVLEQIYK